MGIVVLGAVFVDIKGYPANVYIPGGRNAGRVEIVHGGVSRNLVEDIANVELRPTFVSLVDTTGTGADVIRKLQDHKVNTDYIRAVPDGMGTWLAVFDNGGDVVASISKRPDLRPIVDILDDHGDEIFRQCRQHCLGDRLRQGDRKGGLLLRGKIPQAGICRCVQHEYRRGTAGLSALLLLLRVQPAGGGNSVLRGL